MLYWTQDSPRTRSKNESEDRHSDGGESGRLPPRSLCLVQSSQCQNIIVREDRRRVKYDIDLISFNTPLRLHLLTTLKCFEFDKYLIYLYIIYSIFNNIKLWIMNGLPLLLLPATYPENKINRPDTYCRHTLILLARIYFQTLRVNMLAWSWRVRGPGGRLRTRTQLPLGLWSGERNAGNIFEWRQIFLSERTYFLTQRKYF